MKAVKIVLLSVLSLILVAYLCFLFLVPNIVDANKFTPQIKDEIKKASGFTVDLQNVKILTKWDLSVGAKAQRIDLIAPNNEKFAQLNNATIKISTFPLFLRTLKIRELKADKAMIDLKVEKSGKFQLEKFISEIPQPENTQAKKAATPDIKLSDSMPNISISDYRISFINGLNNDKYTIKGENFNIKDFVLNKKIRVLSKGALILKDKEQITYDFDIFSSYFPSMPEQKEDEKQDIEISLIDIFEHIYKNALTAEIKTNLRIKNGETFPKINGALDVEKLSLNVDRKKLPDGNINLDFSGNKIKIDSKLYTSIKNLAEVNGEFNTSKNKSIDINVKTKNTDIKTSYKVADAFLEVFGINILKDVKAKGSIKADFGVKSDFKKIKSDGYLKIEDASIIYDKLNVSMTDILSNIDFSDNKINIKETSAKINGEPISVSGNIDSKANADIKISASDLKLKGILAATGQFATLKENNIKSGTIDIDATIQGQLDKAVPQADITLNNINIYNKPSKTDLKLNECKIKASSKDQKALEGKVTFLGLILSPRDISSDIKVDKGEINFTEKDIELKNFPILINSSKILIDGAINNYLSKDLNYKLSASGNILANDIKGLLPKDLQKNVKVKGRIPLSAEIFGGKDINIKTHILANQSNNIAIISSKEIDGKTSLIEADISIKGNNLLIKDIALFAFDSQGKFPKDFSKYIKSENRLIRIYGSINKINTQKPVISALNIKVPRAVSIAIPGFEKSYATITSNLLLSGNITNPKIQGSVILPKISIPQLKTSMENLEIDFNKQDILANCTELKIDNSKLAFKADINKDFSKGTVINNIDVMADNIDLDTLGSALSNMPQNTNGPGTDLGITVKGGKGNVRQFKVVGIKASNATAEISLKDNLLSLDKLRADAYGGKLAGEIGYNVIYGNIIIKVQGRGLEASQGLKALLGLPAAPSGALDFDSDITTIGYTQEQLIQGLKGNANFIIKNGRMGQLGQLGHLLYAQNIISNNVFKTSINTVIKAVTIKDTGLFDSIKGVLSFSNGWVNIKYIKTQGPSMSTHVQGRINMLNNSANLTILGRLSGEVIRFLGPLGELSMDRMLSSIPGIGTITARLINQVTMNPEGEDISVIPSLTTGDSPNSKEFKAVINGGISSKNSVKYFKWLAKPVSQTQLYDVQKVEDSIGNIHQQAQQKIQEQVQKTTDQLIEKIQPSSESSKKIIKPMNDFLDLIPKMVE